MTNEKDAHVDQRLRAEPIIWLATTRPDGRPHLVPVWFLWDGETILVFSKPDVKVDNLRHNPSVALSLNSPTGSDVVLLEGTASLLNASEIEGVPAAYAEKYATHMKRLGMNSESMANVYSQPIRIRVQKVRAW